MSIGRLSRRFGIREADILEDRCRLWSESVAPGIRVAMLTAQGGTAANPTERPLEIAWFAPVGR